MLVLTAPVPGLRLGSSDAGTDPPSSTTRKAYDLLASGFGAGFNGTLQIVARTPNGKGDLPKAAALAAKLRASKELASVSPPVSAASTKASASTARTSTSATGPARRAGSVGTSPTPLSGMHMRRSRTGDSSPARLCGTGARLRGLCASTRTITQHLVANLTPHMEDEPRIAVSKGAPRRRTPSGTPSSRTTRARPTARSSRSSHRRRACSNSVARRATCPRCSRTGSAARWSESRSPRPPSSPSGTPSA